MACPGFKAKYSTTVVGQGAENCSWSFLLSVPHLMMMSNLQSIFGTKGNKKPSIQPNDYMDNIITNMKTAMKERYVLPFLKLTVPISFRERMYVSM